MVGAGEVGAGVAVVVVAAGAGVDDELEADA